uniref:Cell division topological specificity factor n=1 Tax=Eucampia antarctica TaxID=49252 RepID=A0A7S2S877_9STRA|mmetsp:Transcript_4437/g.4206  ORF Transcript_4437/g.4206 Transcript_4437/m.4206 type:complete len:111 (+) Transcript_4437:132-464(+)
MSLFTKIGNLFRGGVATAPSSTSPSRNVARERLSVILASQRGSEMLVGVDMKLLQQDVLEVVQRHISVSKNRPVNFQIKNEGEVDLFEMTVELSRNRGGGATVSVQTAQQ